MLKRKLLQAVELHGGKFDRMFDVILSLEAKGFFASADRPLARKLVRCFELLETTPRHHGNIKRLTGDLAGRYRYRVGDWRVIYRIDEVRGRFSYCPPP